MVREMKSVKVGDNSVVLTQSRVNGVTTFHIHQKKGLLYVRCKQTSDIDQALQLYDSFVNNISY